jgi:hypothetical protein
MLCGFFVQAIDLPPPPTLLEYGPDCPLRAVGKQEIESDILGHAIARGQPSCHQPVLGVRIMVGINVDALRIE